MEIAFGGIFALGVIVVFLWGLGTLRELQQGQIELLQCLKRIEAALQLPNEG